MKKIAYFLPGFHEDPLNNDWWGKGFTEWDNIKNSIQLFPGHESNILPKNRCYDLSQVNVLKEQVKKIKQAGLDGIAVYDYWSLGVQPLKKIMATLLENQDIEIDFSICWANHPWTRAWKNKAGALDVLLEQEYDTNDEKMFEYYGRIFSDPRYLRLHDKVFFQIYKPEDIPQLDILLCNLKKYVLTRFGIEIHVSGVIKTPQLDWDFADSLDSITLGNPTACLFSPLNLADKVSIKHALLSPLHYVRSLPKKVKKVLYRLEDVLPKRAQFFDYDTSLHRLLEQDQMFRASTSKPVFSSVYVGFDNTPRYGRRAKIVTGMTFEAFTSCMKELIKRTDKNGFVFINAWNEWGEGMALEKFVDLNLSL